MDLHPLITKASSQPPMDREIAVRQVAEWAVVQAESEAREPGDPEAEATLRRAGALMDSITVGFGLIQGWSLGQYQWIFREGNRLFGTGQLIIPPPNWTEA